MYSNYFEHSRLLKWILKRPKVSICYLVPYCMKLLKKVSLEELLIPGMSFKAVVLFADHLSVIICVVICIKVSKL